MIGLSGKTFLVTGASSGIGRACALALIAAGANVILVGRSKATLCEIGGESTKIYELDLLDQPAVKSLVSRMKEEVGPVDGCVLAAGVHSFRPFLLETFEDIQRPWALNTQAALALTAQLLKARLISKGAGLVLFSSAAAHLAGAGAVSYAASKGAIESATRALALEFATYRIRVNAISAGVVRTPMSDGFLAKLTAEHKKILESRHPLGFGSPEDVAGPVLFLLSDHARWMTGAVLPVDGGFTIA